MTSHAEGFLHLNAQFRREQMRASVNVRLEQDPFVGDFSQAGQAEHLKAAAVREKGTRPVHESMKPPATLHHLVARPQVEVVRIAEDASGSPDSWTSSGDIVFTTPRVPTGMNAGVRTSP